MKGGKTFVGQTVSVVCFKVHVDFVFENTEINILTISKDMITVSKVKIILRSLQSLLPTK